MQIPSIGSISEGCAEIRQKCWTLEVAYDDYLEEGALWLRKMLSPNIEGRIESL